LAQGNEKSGWLDEDPMIFDLEINKNISQLLTKEAHLFFLVLFLVIKTLFANPGTGSNCSRILGGYIWRKTDHGLLYFPLFSSPKSEATSKQTVSSSRSGPC
jgi:hypothetical protein